MSGTRFSPGDRIGRWTILGETMLTDKGEKKWKCRCDCGTERFVLERGLLYGGSVSCGCLRKERAEQAVALDLAGKTFGELTVLNKAGNTKHGASLWRCRCACGQEYVVQGSQLVNGKRTRCTSKVHQKNYAYCDITGQRFERLVALYPVRRYDKSGSVIWRCRCDCGNEVDISYNDLRYTATKSCGCMKKEHDRKLPSFLTHVAGTSVDMLRSKKLPSDNTTGHKGVYFVRGKYIAKIVFQKKQYFLGTFDRIEDAAEARREAESVLFDGVAEHYAKWKQRADENAEWGRQNPVQVFVTQKDQRVYADMLPRL